MKNPSIVISFVTVYLLVFTILGQTNASLSLMLTLFSISPFLVCWMVYVVLRYGNYTGKELDKNEEWGYEDYLKE